MAKRILSILTFSFFLVGCNPPISKEVRAIVQVIEETCPALPWDTDELERGYIDSLILVADEEELAYLAEEHLSPEVKIYAFHALLDLHPQVAANLALRLIRDTSVCQIRWNMCELSTKSLTDIRLELLKKHMGNCSFSEVTLARVDSIVLYTPNLLRCSYLGNLLENLPPQPKYYQRVKDILLKENNSDALPALMAYQKPEDWNYVPAQYQLALKQDSVKNAEQRKKQRKEGGVIITKKSERGHRRFSDAPDYGREPAFRIMNCIKAASVYPCPEAEEMVRKYYEKQLEKNPTALWNIDFSILLAFHTKWAYAMIKSAISWDEFRKWDLEDALQKADSSSVKYFAPLLGIKYE
ncbi:MAG: hypothetical protein J5734_02995 [Prevotella sp.]|nr:hypothetical protein [Prevotella sp.]